MEFALVPVEELVRLIRRAVAEELVTRLPGLLRRRDRRWATVKEFAELSGTSERSVRYRIQSGELPARRVGRRWLIDLEQFEQEGQRI